jgi:hypothetical protein
MKVSITFNLSESELPNFEYWIRDLVDVIDIRVLPDTKELFEKDKYFKKLIKNKRELGLEIDRYINEHNT